MTKKLNVTVDIQAEELRKKLNIKDGVDGKDGKDGKDAIVNAENIAIEASKIAVDKIKPLIPSIEQIEIDIPKLGEPIRDSLELLKGENRLDKSAIRGLDDYDEVSKLARKPKVEKIYQTGGGAKVFTSLLDVPNSYSGQTLKFVRVKTDETGLEFADVSLSGYVPYTGATSDVDLNTHRITAGDITITDHFVYDDSVQSLKIGFEAGKNIDPTANNNLYLGYQSGYSDSLSPSSAASFNLGIGNYTFLSNTTGNNNIAIGHTVLQDNIEGSNNTAIGISALVSNQTGNNNVAVGESALGSNVTGNKNVAIGESALRGITANDNNIGVGYFAGRYATTNNELYINNQDRVNNNGDKTQSIIYGVMAGSAASQQLNFNVSSLNIGNPSTGSAEYIYSSNGSTLIPALTTGNWTLGTGWTFGTSPDRIIKSTNGTGLLTQTGGTAPTVNTLYKVTITVTGWSVGSFTWTLGGNGNGGIISADGTYTTYVQAKDTTRFIATPTNTSRFTISAISVQAVTLGSLTTEGSAVANRFTSPTGLFQSTVPYGTPVTTPRMEFYAKDGNTGYPDNDTEWFTWYADVNNTKQKIMRLYAVDATTYALQGNFLIAPNAIKSSAGNGGSITIQYGYLLFSQAGNNLWLDISKADTNSGLNFQTKMSNGATAYGYQFDTLNSFTTSGAKLAKFLNAGTEKASIDKDGGFIGSGLFVSSGGVINFNSGDVTLTHSANKLTLGGGDLDISAQNIITDATTGTKIGISTTQKLGFWNTTPIVQPAAANQAALTNSTGGSYDGTLVDVTTAMVADPSKINDNFMDVYTLLTEIRTALVNSGIIKGSA